jgi:DNA polymerase
VLCVSWALDDGPVQVAEVRDNNPPGALIAAMLQCNEFHAWNAVFEQAVLARMMDKHRAGGTFPFTLNFANYRCSMVRAAYYGLPMKLDTAAQALMLPIRKDAAGARVMHRLCRASQLITGSTGPQWHYPSDHEPEAMKALMAYCAQDVEVERAIAKEVPPLPDAEQRLWELDCAVNARGVGLDRKLIDRMKAVADQAQRDLGVELVAMIGIAPTQAVALLDFVNTVAPVPVADLRKDTVAGLLARDDLTPTLRRVLEIRQAAAKTSVKKLDAMLYAAGPPEDRVRHLTQFYGAGRTGRDAGRVVQFQNLPRPLQGLDTKQAIKDILAGADTEYLRAFHGRPLDVVSSLLRSCIVAETVQYVGSGHTLMPYTRGNRGLVIGDFSQIEARVVAWLAGQHDLLAVFASGQDVYTYTANKIGSPDRQLGKVLVLACGFGMGPAKFQATAAAGPRPIHLSAREADAAVHGWREANHKIVSLWYGLDRAVRATLEDGKQRGVGQWLNVKMGSKLTAGCLAIQLPSGRHLVYRNARIMVDEDGENIVFDGINQTSRKWETLRTYGGKLVENAVQAVARDIVYQALVRLEADRWKCLLKVHDEIVARARADATVADFTRIMAAPLAWAPGLPIACEVKEADRYGK